MSDLMVQAPTAPAPPAVASIQAGFAQLANMTPASFASALDSALGGTSAATAAAAGTAEGATTATTATGAATDLGTAGVSGGADALASGTGAASGGAPTAAVALAALPAAGGLGQQAVALARAELGVPYQWGGTSPQTGFDCSGLVQYVYGKLGVNLPRTSEEQATAGVAVPDLAAAQPGDLLFFEPGPGGPGHVGIYIGNGQMIDAPHTGVDVRVDPVWATPVAIRRVVPTVASTTAVVAPQASASAVANVPASLASLVSSSAASAGVPAGLLAGLLQTESGFNPSAVSPAGAEGIAQFMPSTAASLGVNPFDPQQAVPAAARLLSGYHTQFGSWDLALAAYNAGPGAVEQYGGIPPYPETQAYVARIDALAGISS